MDLQKVAIQANNNAAQNGQRAETSPTGGNTALPFADMIRLPLVGVGDLFSNLAEHPASINKPADDYHQGNSEDRAPTEEAASRKDTPDYAQRDDNTRADNQTNDRVEKPAARDDSPRDDQSPREDQENHAAEEGPSDEVGRDSLDDTDTSVADDGDSDSDTDTAVVSTTASGEVTDSTKPGDLTVEPTMAGLINTAQNAGQAQTTRDPVQAVKDSSASSNGAKVTTLAPTSLIASDNPSSTQDADGDIQQVLRQVVRQGTNPSVNADTNKPVDQTLAQQQAKLLSDTLKSDKPVKVTVNTENRANVAVSQPSQSLSSNALAAQNSEGVTQATTGLQSNARPAQLQAPVPDTANQNTAQANAQTQATTQAAAATAGNSSQRSFNATNQASAGQHGSVGGAEASGGSTATTPGMQAQQTAAAQRPQLAQAPRAAQAPQPITQQISVNITKAIAEGMDRIFIQLRPDNLGRVEVKLEVGQNGRVSAQIIVDRPEALEALRNDSRDLEKALQDAGLQANAGDLSFSLRDQQENPEDSDSGNRLAGDEEDSIDGDLEAELATRLLNGDLDGLVSDTRVDIKT